MPGDLDRGSVGDIRRGEADALAGPDLSSEDRPEVKIADSRRDMVAQVFTVGCARSCDYAVAIAVAVAIAILSL